MPQVTLKPVTEKEIESTFHWVRSSWYVTDFCGHEVMDYVTHHNYMTLAIRNTKNWENSGSVYLAVFLNCEHVGNAGIKNIKDGRGEVWYYLGSEAIRGDGIGTLVVEALVGYAKNKCNLSFLYARVLPCNIASCRVLEKNNFKKLTQSYDQELGREVLTYVSADVVSYA